MAEAEKKVSRESFYNRFSEEKKYNVRSIQKWVELGPSLRGYDESFPDSIRFELESLDSGGSI